MSEAIDLLLKQKTGEIDARKAAEADPDAHPAWVADPSGFLSKAIKDARRKHLGGKVHKDLDFPPGDGLDATLGYLPYMDPATLTEIENLAYPKRPPPPAMRPAQNSGVGAASSAKGLKDLLAATKKTSPFDALLQSAQQTLPGQAGAPIDPNSIK